MTEEVCLEQPVHSIQQRQDAGRSREKRDREGEVGGHRTVMLHAIAQRVGANLIRSDRERDALERSPRQRKLPPQVVHGYALDWKVKRPKPLPTPEEVEHHVAQRRRNHVEQGKRLVR